VTWVPRDLWSESTGDRINRAFAIGGFPLLAAALAEHGLDVAGAVVLRRGATEELLRETHITVPVPRPLEFSYPLASTARIEDGAKVIRFDPPSESLAGERLHQWLGARTVPGGVGSDLHRITRQQTAVRVLLEDGAHDVRRVLADSSRVDTVGGAETIATIALVRSSWSFSTLDDVVPRTIAGKSVLVRDRGPTAPIRSLVRRLRQVP